jgi:ribosome maturation factor RimP
VWELAEPIAKDLGLILWDVRFQKEGANWFLRIFIDKEGGVNIDDCVNMSHALDGPLDELDPIEQSYSLQVSSPGIERELTRDFHFEQNIGEKVMVRFIHAYEGKRDYKGVLIDYDNGMVTIELDDEIGLGFNKKEASYVKLDDFGGFNENE